MRLTTHECFLYLNSHTSRPHTGAKGDEDYIKSPTKPLNSTLNEDTMDQSTLAQQPTLTETVDIREMAYHPSDFTVSPVVDNPKVCTNGHTIEVLLNIHNSRISHAFLNFMRHRCLVCLSDKWRSRSF